MSRLAWEHVDAWPTVAGAGVNWDPETWIPEAGMSSRREKAWRWVEGLLKAAAPDGVSYPVLEAVLRDVPYDDPYEVINDWTREGWLVIANGEHRVHSRRYTLGAAVQ